MVPFSEPQEDWPLEANWHSWWDCKEEKESFSLSWATCHQQWIMQCHNIVESTNWKLFASDLESHQMNLLTISKILLILLISQLGHRSEHTSVCVGSISPLNYLTLFIQFIMKSFMVWGENPHGFTCKSLDKSSDFMDFINPWICQVYLRTLIFHHHLPNLYLPIWVSFILSNCLILHWLIWCT